MSALSRVEIKVCGITRRPDAELAVRLGAGFLGFIFYPKSPRCIGADAYRTLADGLGPVKKVYVQVRPEREELARAVDEGFDYFQLHFAAEEGGRLAEEWAETVSREKLWLAPRIAPGEPFPERLLPVADTFLIDTYRSDGFGGSGATGDWGRFREWSERHPEKRWILAGGLDPSNVVAAVEASGAAAVDVNSGVEAAPGQKDHDRLRAVFAALKGTET